MFAPIEFGTTNFEERITRRDGAWTILHRDVMTPPDAPVWTASERGPAAPVEALPRDGALTRRTFRFEDVPEGADPVAGRLPVLFNRHLTLSWLSADSASPTTVFTDHDGDQLVCVLEGGATLDTPCGTLRANAAEHVLIPRGLAHRWKVDKLGLRALLVELRGELSVPRAWRNDYGQLSPDGPFGARDLHRPGWFSRPHQVSAPVRCTLRRDGRSYDGSVPYDPFATVGFEGSVYPVSVAWEAPFMRSHANGIELFASEQCSIRTRVTREDQHPLPSAFDLASLTIDGDGAASLVWDPQGVAAKPVGVSGAIVIEVCAHEALRLTANGALLATKGPQIPR